MLLRRLRYFVTVAAEGGISRAAGRLRVAQPALSRQIRELERVVGVPLFERDHRGVQLTSAGARLRDDVERVFARLDEALRHARLAHAGRRASLRLGLSRGALNSRRIGDVIISFRAQYPDVDLLMRDIEVSSQAHALKSEDVDAVIGLGDDRDPAFHSETLFEERVDSALLAASHALAIPGPIEPRELMAETLHLDAATLPRFPALRRALEHLGFRYNELEGVETVYSYVAAGNGWTSAPSSAHLDAHAGLVVRRIVGLDVPIPMSLRWRKSDDPPVVRNLVAMARSAVATDGRAGVAHEDHESLVTSGLPVELPQLVALVTSLQLGSLSAAAERLDLTQSAVSRQIHSLEGAVGVPLIARTGGRITATAAGAVLLDQATLLLESVEIALDRARLTTRRAAGRCAIGTLPRELTSGLLVGALKELSERCPDTTITVTEGRSQDALIAGDVDLVIAAMYSGATDDASLESVLLRDDPLDTAIVAASNPLAQHETVSLADLGGTPLLMVSRSYAPAAYDLIVQELRRRGMGGNIGANYNGARTIWRAVASGGGWGIGTHSLRTAPPPGTVAVPIDDVSIPWGIGLQWRRDESDPVVTQVVDVLRARAELTA